MEGRKEGRKEGNSGKERRKERVHVAISDTVFEASPAQLLVCPTSSLSPRLLMAPKKLGVSVHVAPAHDRYPHQLGHVSLQAPSVGSYLVLGESHDFPKTSSFSGLYATRITISVLYPSPEMRLE